jgi:hypothetical protein
MNKLSILDRYERVLRDIAEADETEPRQPDDADWRFRFLECKRIAALALYLKNPGAGAEPATSVRLSRSSDQVGRTGGSIPPTGAASPLSRPDHQTGGE